MTPAFEDLPLSERLALSGAADPRGQHMYPDPSLLQLGGMIAGSVMGAYSRPVAIPTLLPGTSAFDAVYASVHGTRQRQQLQSEMNTALGRMTVNSASAVARHLSGGRLSGEALYSLGRHDMVSSSIGALAGPFLQGLTGGSPMAMAEQVFATRNLLDTAAGGYSEPLSMSRVFDKQGRAVDASRDERKTDSAMALIRGAVERTYGKTGGLLPDLGFTSGLSSTDMGYLMSAMTRENAGYSASVPVAGDPERTTTMPFQMRGGTSTTSRKLDEIGKYAKVMAKTMEVLGTTDIGAAMDALDKAAGGRMFKMDPEKLKRTLEQVSGAARMYGASAATLFDGMSQMTASVAQVTGGVNRVSGAVTAPTMGMYVGLQASVEASRLAAITGRPVEQHQAEVGNTALRVLGSPGGKMAQVMGGLLAMGQISGDQFNQYTEELQRARNDPARMRELATEIGQKTVGRDLWSITSDPRAMSEMAKAIETRPDVGERVVYATMKAARNEADIRARRAMNRRLENIVRGAGVAPDDRGDDDATRIRAMREHLEAARAAASPAEAEAAAGRLEQFDKVVQNKRTYTEVAAAVDNDGRLATSGPALRAAADTAARRAPASDDATRIRAMREHLEGSLSDALGNPAATAKAEQDLARFDTMARAQPKYADLTAALGRDSRMAGELGALRDAADGRAAAAAARAAIDSGRLSDPQAIKNAEALIGAQDLLAAGDGQPGDAAIRIATTRATSVLAREWAENYGDGDTQDSRRVAAVGEVLRSSGSFMRRQLELTDAGRMALGDLERVQGAEEPDQAYKDRRAGAADTIGAMVAARMPEGELKDLLRKREKTDEDLARQRVLADKAKAAADMATSEVRRMNPGASDELLEYAATPEERKVEQARQEAMADADRQSEDLARAFGYTGPQRLLGYLSGAEYKTSDGKRHKFKFSDVLGIKDMGAVPEQLRAAVDSMDPQSFRDMSQERAFELYDQFEDPESAARFMDAYNQAKTVDSDLISAAGLEASGSPRVAGKSELRQLAKAKAAAYVSGLDDDSLGDAWYQSKSGRRDELRQDLADKEYDRLVDAKDRPTSAAARKAIGELSGKAEEQTAAREGAAAAGGREITGTLRIITSSGTFNAILEPGSKITGDQL